MGRSLVGDDEYSSSIDLEHQKQMDGKDERIRFLEANLRRLQDQVENGNSQAESKQKNKSEMLEIEIKRAKNEALEIDARLKKKMIENDQLKTERDNLLNEVNARNSSLTENTSLNDEVDRLHDKIDEMRETERKILFQNKELELQIEEQGKVKAMIEGEPTTL